MKTWHESMKTGGIDSYSNFMGDPEEYKDLYVLLSRSRDSDILTESNFDCALESLGGESDNVQVHRFGHWACGWFELLMIKGNTKEFNKAEEIEGSLENYPVLNDSDCFEREWDAKTEYWQEMDLSERIELCVNNDYSIFAAHSQSIPGNLDQCIDIY